MAILDQYGHPMATQTPRRAVSLRPVRARYDAAQTTDDNRRHWSMADGLSAVSANRQEVRRRLRNRSRYEVANNSYARGMLNTIAAYTVGRGPTLQLSFRGEQKLSDRTLSQIHKAAQEVEQLWNTWAYVRGLQHKLVTACLAVDQDGECFATKITGRVNMHTPVSLDIKLYEADQFEDPTGGLSAGFAGGGDIHESGVRTDSTGEPTEYAMLDYHPGDYYNIAQFNARWVSHDQVLHMFRRERPGQLRGIPRTTPALELFAQLRRYTLATLTAAETAADIAAVIYSDNPGEDEAQMDPWDRVEFERGAMVTAPGGTRLSQLKAEHPTTTYGDFVKTVLREIARCLGIPAVLALGDASNYNYSSGRLDLQNFQRQMSVDRGQIFETQFLDRIFEEWLDEALLITVQDRPGGEYRPFLPTVFQRRVKDFEWSWRWDEPEHVDRGKEASGQEIELRSGTTNLKREYARKGLDWDTELTQRSIEVKRMIELELLPEDWNMATTGASQPRGGAGAGASGGDGASGNANPNDQNADGGDMNNVEDMADMETADA